MRVARDVADECEAGRLSEDDLAAIVDRHAGTALPVLRDCADCGWCIRGDVIDTVAECQHPDRGPMGLLDLSEPAPPPPSCPLRERTTP